MSDPNPKIFIDTQNPHWLRARKYLVDTAAGGPLVTEGRVGVIPYNDPGITESKDDAADDRAAPLPGQGWLIEKHAEVWMAAGGLVYTEFVPNEDGVPEPRVYPFEPTITTLNYDLSNIPNSIFNHRKRLWRQPDNAESMVYAAHLVAPNPSASASDNLTNTSMFAREVPQFFGFYGYFGQHDDWTWNALTQRWGGGSTYPSGGMSCYNAWNRRCFRDPSTGLISTAPIGETREVNLYVTALAFAGSGAGATCFAYTAPPTYRLSKVLCSGYMGWDPSGTINPRVRTRIVQHARFPRRRVGMSSQVAYNSDAAFAPSEGAPTEIRVCENPFDGEGLYPFNSVYDDGSGDYDDYGGWTIIGEHNRSADSSEWVNMALSTTPNVDVVICGGSVILYEIDIEGEIVTRSLPLGGTTVWLVPGAIQIPCGAPGRPAGWF